MSEKKFSSINPKKSFLSWSLLGLSALLFGIVTPNLMAAELPDNVVDISSNWFDPSGTITLLNNGDQEGSGSFSQGNPHGYIAGSCIPFVHTIENSSNETGDVSFGVSYDTNNGKRSFDDLELITSDLGASVLSATNLDQFTYTGTSLSGVNDFTVPTLLAPTESVSIDVSGPVLEDDSGTYSFVVHNLPANDTAYISLCGRLGKKSHDKGTIQIRTQSSQNNGNETLAINRNNILPLPSLTISKIVDGGNAVATDWSFEVSPSINDQSVFTFADDESSVTIDDVLPDEYSITELDTENTPEGYSLTQTTGENCSATLDGGTATINTTENGVENATCEFTNTYTPPTPTGTLTLHKIVDGGDFDPENAVFYVDGENLTEQIITKNNGIHTLDIGEYSVSEETIEGYVPFYSPSCAKGNVEITANENVDCTITNVLIVPIDPPPTPVSCDGATNMLVNGSFETPVITNNANWDIVPDNTEGLGWDVDWTGGISTFQNQIRPEDAVLEIWKNLNGWASFDGNQHAELDTDWFGPSSNLTNEPAGVAISQSLITTPGYTYRVAFSYAGRPQQNDTNNQAMLLIGGNEITSVTGTTGTSGLVWTTFETTFVATESLTTITLQNVGPEDSFGLLIDDVSVICEPQPARLTITKIIDNGNYGSLTLDGVSLFVNEDSVSLNENGVNTSEYTNGHYTVTEEENPFYEMSFSGDCNANGELNLALNDVKNCTVTNTYTPVCNVVGNLLTNGSFETPIITNDKHWDVVEHGTENLGWNVDWYSTETTFNSDIRPEIAKIELWNHLNNWLSFAGDQNVELDTDWGGPNNQIAGEEPASVIISQTINTVPGVEYTLHFAYAGRPNRPENDNQLVFNINGVDSDIISAPASPTLDWQEITYSFTATDWTSTVSFRDAGPANSYGMALDDVSVFCEEAINNDDEDAYLTVIKEIINDNGGLLTIEEVELFVDANHVTSGSIITLAPGIYTVSETPVEGYTGTFSGDCDATGSVTLEAGQTKICNLTNNDNSTGGNNGGGTTINFRIQPLLECVDHLGEGLYRAHFGYDTDNDSTETINIGSLNYFSGGGTDDTDQGQPSVFTVPNFYTENPGRTEMYPNSLFTVDFNGEELTWGLYSDDWHFAHASYLSPTCVPPEDSASLTVIKEIINDNGGRLTLEEVELFVNGDSITPGSTVTLSPGDHVVSETLIPRYRGTFSGDCDSRGRVTLESGDHKTCTLTNNDIRRGGGGGGSVPTYENIPEGGTGGSTPTNDPIETPTPPEGRVLGETDETPTETPSETLIRLVNDSTPVVTPPEGRVLGAEDELPRTGMPISLMALLALMAVGFAIPLSKQQS